ncbi:MAG: hypothetical protein ACT4R6_14005 [Gemmatimonadaceae bacterium]
MWPALRASAPLLIAGLAACGDPRVKELSAGISRDSVLTILGDGQRAPAGDSLPHVYDVAAYLVNSVNYEVFFYTRGHAVAGADSLPREELTPIVLQDGSVSGWGWQHWDSVSKAINLPAPSTK